MRKSISITENHNKEMNDTPLNIVAKINEDPVVIKLKNQYNVAIFFGNDDNVKIYLLEKETNEAIGHYILNSISLLRAFLSDSFAPTMCENAL